MKFLPKLLAWTPFLMTAAKGQLEVMKYLVSKGANITYTHPITEFNALHHAAFNGHKAMVDYLVEIGIDKTKNLKGDVSIIRALNEDGKEKMAEYLLSIGFKDEGCQEKRCF
jgi:ankyrin repeat protein